MKTIGVYNYNSNDLAILEEKLKKIGIEFKALDSDRTEENIDLYAFNIDNNDGFDIRFDYPFIVISSLDDSIYLRKSLKIGALDFIRKPFIDIDITSKRILRIIEKIESPQNFADLSNIEKYNKLIDVEIKRAHRGKYSLYLGKLSFEVKLNQEVLTKLTKKVKEVLRESDSCMLYPDGSIYLLLPFTDKEGIVTAIRKVIDQLNDLDYKGYCLCAKYPDDGDSREELLNNIGNSLDTRELYI